MIASVAARALCVLLVVAPGLASAADATRHPWNQGVPWKTATIKYQIKGSEPGSRVLYLRNYGDDRATVTHTSAGPVASGEPERHTIELATTYELTRIDMGTRTGLRALNKLPLLVAGYSVMNDADKAKVMTEARKAANRFPALRGRPEEPAKGEFLGHKCDIVEIGGITTYYIEGTTIPLKSEGVQGDRTIETVAVEIDTKTPVPDDVFTVPADVKVRDLRETQSKTIKETIEKELDALRGRNP